ncbi:hypothetical protein VTK56DRAFT_3629 [Thermocarpiscus australiensis]
MQPTIFLATLLAAAAGVHAKCNRSGETWGNVLTALVLAQVKCDEFFSGTFGPTDTPGGYRNTCANANGKKLEFHLWHVRGGDRQISAEECYDGFQKEIVGCSRGGDTTYTNWRYKADPNAGKCSD